MKIKLVKVQCNSTHWYVRLGQLSPKLRNVAKKKKDWREKKLFNGSLYINYILKIDNYPSKYIIQILI